MRSILRSPLAAAGVLSLAFHLPLAPAVPRFTIHTIAGSNEAGDYRPATEAQLISVEDLAMDASGALYISDAGDHRVRRVDPGGLIHTVAGDGNPGFAGDGQAAVRGQLASPYGLAVDPQGRLFIADFQNLRIRQVTPGGEIRTVAGGGERPAAADGQALAGRFLGPRNVALDPAGNLFISDFIDHRIYRLSSGGRLETVAGNGVRGAGRDGLAVASELDAPASLAVDRFGVLWIADSGNRRIRRLHGTQIWTVVIQQNGRDVLRAPVSLAFDAAGNLLIADSVPGGPDRLWRYKPNGAVDLLLETGPGLPDLSSIRAVCVDGSGNIYLGGGSSVVRISPSGSVARVAGGGNFRQFAEGSPALASYLSAPRGLALDPNGDVYFAETMERRVRRLDPSGRLFTVAGGGASADSGPALEAALSAPLALLRTSDGLLHIADSLGHRVRTLRPAGTISTLAGTGRAGFGGDGLTARYAALSLPSGLAMDSAGNIFISDQGNLRVRRIDPQGRITTVAGSGVRGYFGDGGPALEAQLNFPGALAADAHGYLYIADSGNNVIRRVSPAGIITTYAGSGSRGYGGDGGPATRAALNLENPGALAVDAAGNLYIADSYNHRIRCVTPDGLIHTVAGDGVQGFWGDGESALDARLNTPAGLALAPNGTLYVSDSGNRRIRMLVPVALRSDPIEQPSQLSVLHGASFTPGPVAPGQIVSIFGAKLVPAASASASVEVRFDGRSAHVFFTGENQVNAQVPAEVAGSTQTTVEVYTDGRLRGRSKLGVTSAAPGLFTRSGGAGPAAALNEDGTLNSRENPAARGSIVTFWATGEGLPGLPLSLRVGSSPAELLYAGAAPGFPGLMQINARMPGPFSPPGELPVVLRVGEAASPPGVTVFLK
jgi:uncharacterized protein (TIGR03437 family)